MPEAELQAAYGDDFSREYGCTEAEWLMWLPAALGEGLTQQGPQWAEQHWPSHPGARLRLTWSVQPPRVIALAVLPRLAVHFRFEGLDAAQRYTYMRRFDLYMQRGGG